MNTAVVIALSNPKYDVNIASVIRNAYCFQNVKSIYYTGNTKYKGNNADTQKGSRYVPITKVDNIIDSIPYGFIPVAVELLPYADSIYTFKHPKSAYYIFGGEGETLGRKVTDSCKDVIYIPTKYCLNLAQTVGIVLYDRNLKKV